jgi:hypothetical protein
MIQENEIIMLALGIGSYFFAVINKIYLERVPAWPTLLLAYRILLAAWVLTVLEGFLFPEALNILEHGCYAVSALVLAFWCRQATRSGKEMEE